ncbi:hypothetical protein SASPL_124346 [Salvia splendens]|uniref:Uncharacterized protein n=1 Tax=Salvia splendens TaxID=180675 RepID=A0A8X8XN27_SALSN|nr:hypothetical protein SASPL_124346 [Salvia splendens]
MSDLSIQRHRLHGRIEGNVERLRAQRDQIFTGSPIPTKSVTKSTEIDASPSPPRAPVAIKRRRIVGLMDGDEEESGMVSLSGGEIGSAKRSSSGEANLRNGGEVKGGGGKKKLVKGGRKVVAAVVAAASGIRRSPRLSKMRRLSLPAKVFDDLSQ